jgi:hypothetical protein
MNGWTQRFVAILLVTASPAAASVVSLPPAGWATGGLVALEPGVGFNDAWFKDTGFAPTGASVSWALDVDHAGPTMVSNPAPGISGATVSSAMLKPDPAAVVDVQADPAGYADAVAGAWNSFEVTGPDAVSVPVSVQYKVAFSASPGARYASLAGFYVGEDRGFDDTVPFFGDQGLDVPDIGVGPLKEICNDNVGLACDDKFVVADALQGSVSGYIQSNTVYTIVEFASAAVIGGSAHAVADPHVFIDPSFGLPGYSLILSNGVGNAPIPGVPEPDAWVMMLLGVCGVGGFGRASRRARAVAAGVS